MSQDKIGVLTPDLKRLVDVLHEQNEYPHLQLCVSMARATRRWRKISGCIIGSKVLPGSFIVVP